MHKKICNICFIYFIVIICSVLTASVRIYYFYDPINDSYTFTNICNNLHACRPLLMTKGKVKHRSNYKLTPGKAKAFDSIIKKAAAKYGIDFYLIKSIIKAESLFDKHARSSAGALGLMQLMPDTAKMLGVANPFSPEENIHGGTRYFKHLLGKFKDTEKALAAYNAGPASVVFYRGIPPFTETQNYVRKIKKFYFEYTRKML